MDSQELPRDPKSNNYDDGDGKLKVEAVVVAVIRAVMSKKKGKNKMVEGSAVVAANPNEPAELAAQMQEVVPDCNQDEVAALAYKLWQERGCPIGSDQEDWFRAENEVQNRKVSVASAA